MDAILLQSMRKKHLTNVSTDTLIDLYIRYYPVGYGMEGHEMVCALIEVILSTRGVPVSKLHSAVKAARRYARFKDREDHVCPFAHSDYPKVELS